MIEIGEHAGGDALHSIESHVSRGFGKARDGRYIGFIGANGIAGLRSRARVIGLHELGSDPVQLVGERGEEILSSHVPEVLPCPWPVRPRGWWWAA